ncbi:PAS domain S-box protein [Flavobacterium sp.]|uniref:PAS domain S-box protein n=1 Tax=Flavobacterium sp. TaxID=239 RepID=UPI00286DED24|nr:PAS domain S-box protein [Flavobacterium sp.]
MTFILEKRTKLFYIVSTILLTTVLVIFYANSQKEIASSKKLLHTQVVINKSNEVLIDVLNIETGFRGYLLSGNKVFLAPYELSKSKVYANLDSLELLIKDNPNQEINLTLLKKQVADRLRFTEKYLATKTPDLLTNSEKTRIIEEEKIIADKIRAAKSAVTNEEFRLLNARKIENENDYQSSEFIFFLLLVFLATIFILGFLIIKSQKEKNQELESHTAEQKSASRYALSLIEASQDPLVTISVNGKIMDMNEALVNVTGVTREELVGSDFFDYFTDQQSAREVYQEVFEKGSVADSSLTIRHKDGKLTDVLFNGSVYRNDNGEILGVVIVARDIAEQKWALDLQIANKELAYQNQEKENRANELSIANEELAYQNQEKENRANELGIANEELAYQNQEKENRAQELILANKELLYQKDEKQNRADELGIANIELLHQQTEKQNRADELIIANKELLFQTGEKQDRADELEIADKELDFQNQEKVKRAIENKELEDLNSSLKLASQYSRSLIEASLDPLVTISAEGKITDVNNASIKITGVEREKLIGTDFSHYFTDPKKAQEGYRQVFENGYVEDYPLTIKHISGKLTDVLYNASVYKDDNDKVLGVFAAARDITEQNKQKVKSDIATKNLEESNDSLKLASQYSRSLIEASLDPLVTISVEGKITDVNNASIKVTGVEREKLVGTDFSNYFTDPKKAQEGYRQVFENGYVEDYPLTIKHISGKLTDVLYNASVYKDDNDKVLGVFAAARDITEQNKQKLKSDNANKNLEYSNDSLKLASQYSLSLIEASRDPLFTISPDGKITDTNQASVRVTDVSKENLIGSDFITYFTEPEKAKKGYEEVFSKGFVVDYPLTVKDGKLTPVLFNGSVYKDENGNRIGAVVVARDITEQKKAEKELIEAKVFAELATEIAEEEKRNAEAATLTAENAVKAKQQFLSNMSHEIRTPMNAIIGFTKVVLKTDLTDKQKEYVSAIKLSGDAMIVLINDILDLAKVDAGKMTFEHIPFKLSSSISAMLHVFETKIQEKNLELISEYDTNIPEVLIGDPVRLHQIILNLVSNAIKFTSKGKITVSVRLFDEDEASTTVEFAISDTGIGIDEIKMETIFDNFQQATSGTSRLYGGTGLGLAIVKQLVEPQGGTVCVKSKIDEGSTFSFTLKFLKTTIGMPSEADAVDIEMDFKSIKVLVVEDMPLNILLMKTLLDDFGFERDIAENGQIAIEKLQEKQYDIVLMDLQMPVMNGFEATEYIRNTMKSKIPIIALTADVTTVDLAKCKSVGMNDYIAKPVDERELYNKIVSLVKKPIFHKGAPKDEEVMKTNQKEITEIKYTNLEYLHVRTKSNPKLMMEMISIYLQQTPPLLDSMRQSVVDKNWPLLAAAAHKIIPSFSIMGMSQDVENMARKIQEDAVAGQFNNETAQMVLKLETICRKACKELEIEFNLIKNT